MTTVIMTKGLPGSGKSTWAKEYVLKALPGNVVRINKDDLRAMLHADRWNPANEKQIIRARDALVEAFLLKKVSAVVVDDTNFASIHETRLRQLAERHGAQFRIKDFTDVPLHTCIKRDLLRAKSVGKDVIEKMHKQYLTPAPVAPPVHDPALLDAVLVDIDGTLARMVGRGPFDWDKVDQDEPIKNVVDSIRDIYWGSHTEIIFMSGRDACCSAKTARWLRDHVGEWVRDRPLFMRPEGDMRKDAIVKEEIYRREVEGKYNVRAIYDDRDQVVNMWRGLGLTCFQVAPGAF